MISAVDRVTYGMLNPLIFPIQAAAEGFNRRILTQGDVCAQNEVLVAVVSDFIELLRIHNQESDSPRTIASCKIRVYFSTKNVILSGFTPSLLTVTCWAFCPLQTDNLPSSQISVETSYTFCSVPSSYSIGVNVASASCGSRKMNGYRMRICRRSRTIAAFIWIPTFICIHLIGIQSQ